MNGELADDDKSIADVSLLRSSDTSIAMQIAFSEASSISSDISEPDELRVEFSLPQLFLDAETGEPLSVIPIEKIINLSP